MANRKVTKDVSDAQISAAVIASFWGEKTQRIVEAHATDHTKITVNKGGYYIPLLIGDTFFLIDSATHVSSVTDLDTGSLAAGTDYYVYACDNAGALAFKISAASTYPSGFNASTSRKIGGFHTLCADVGTIASHTLTGYVNKDILPASIWDLKHRAKCGNNAGMAFCSMSKVWIDIYLASGTGANAVSVNSGTISDTRTWNDFVDDGGAVGKRLLSDTEFQLSMDGSNQKTNINGSADPVTTGGHSDTAGRRMISNCGLEDGCGAMYQWLLDQSYRYDSDGTLAAASKTLTAYHAASPGGNPIYVKYANGRPYLCCNLATTAVNKWLTFGSAVTIQLIHDANAATGGYQLFFNEAATQPGRLLCALPGGKSDCLDTSDPNYPLKITYDSAPASHSGVALNFDDGTDQRLEYVSPTTANNVIDLASYGLTFTSHDPGGNKGTVYSQAAYGDVKLIAGGAWSNGAYCGSRYRYANNYRWSTSSYLGARFASEPM